MYSWRQEIVTGRMRAQRAEGKCLDGMKSEYCRRQWYRYMGCAAPMPHCLGALRVVTQASSDLSQYSEHSCPFWAKMIDSETQARKIGSTWEGNNCNEYRIWQEQIKSMDYELHYKLIIGVLSVAWTGARALRGLSKPFAAAKSVSRLRAAGSEGGT